MTTALPAQTARIAHKSHSGTAANFATTHRHYDHHASNFGLAPTDIVRTARLDSVIYLNDSLAVMVTSEACQRKRRNRTSVWRAGRDTVIAHPLFRHPHHLDSIRRVLDRDYYFVNEARETVFIGYDNEEPKPPIAPGQQQSEPRLPSPPTNGQQLKLAPTPRQAPAPPQNQLPAQQGRSKPAGDNSQGEQHPLSATQLDKATHSQGTHEVVRLARVSDDGFQLVYLLAALGLLWGAARWWRA